jgi:hypothetical protein
MKPIDRSACMHTIEVPDKPVALMHRESENAFQNSFGQSLRFGGYRSSLRNRRKKEMAFLHDRRDIVMYLPRDSFGRHRSERSLTSQAPIGRFRIEFRLGSGRTTDVRPGPESSHAIKPYRKQPILLLFQRLKKVPSILVNRKGFDAACWPERKAIMDMRPVRKDAPSGEQAISDRGTPKYS